VSHVDAAIERENPKVSTETGERLAHHFTSRSYLHGEVMRFVEEEQLRERPELIRLVGQCSILVVIAGIVAGLIAA
jgi:hypothetical protein